MFILFLAPFRYTYVQGGESMEYSDFDLIRGIKSGNRSALDILIRRWYSRIYGYTFKMIGHEQDAYDITQDVFVAVIQNIGSYHPWKNSIAIFLRSYTISVWATLDFTTELYRLIPYQTSKAISLHSLTT